MKKLVILASALAILATPALAGTITKHHHKAHQKVAQGPAGLNGGNIGGPGFPAWSGPANNWNNPISGSQQDPAMQHRPVTPGR